MPETEIQNLVLTDSGYANIIKDLQHTNESLCKIINKAKEDMRWFLETFDNDPDCDCKNSDHPCDWCEGINKLKSSYALLNGGIEYQQ